MNNFSVIDLHCDLLSYIGDGPKRSAYDLQSCCAIPQLVQGKVLLQMLAIFCGTGKDSVAYAERQIQIFENLDKNYPEIKKSTPDQVIEQKNQVHVMASIEGASAICGADEKLEAGLARLRSVQQRVNKLGYISLTWFDENRFAGGATSAYGLKEDGKVLLDLMCELSIPIDLSHANDYLVDDILQYVDGKKNAHVMASHSNVRSVFNVDRNLKDDHLAEIFKRGGIVGINSLDEFLGDSEVATLSQHLSTAIELGGEDGLCFGADYFFEGDIPPEYQAPPGRTMFVTYWQNAGEYQQMLGKLGEKGGFSSEILKKFSSQNASNFYKKVFK